MIVKVYIDEGCIVCDSCEDICPEVFHVTGDTCIVREGVDFNAHAENIKIAAEDCPTEVIIIEEN